MNDVTAFRVAYDGPALETSEMDVRELAPALLALGGLLEAATYAVHGDAVKPQVNVRGSFKTGSFGIDFTFATTLLTRVRDMLAGQEATAFANATAILSALGLVTAGARFGLIALLKRLRGRRVTRVETIGNRAVLYVDEEAIEVELEVLAMYRSRGVRQALERTLAPLRSEGINVFFSGAGAKHEAEIADTELDYFAAPEDEEEPLIDEVRRMAFSIVNLAFKDDNKWRLHDGQATIHAAISDEIFLRDVDANAIRFAKNDVLLCDVRVQQWQTVSGTRTEYEIVKVVEHRPAMQQIAIPGV